jgi:hypothetical protein
VLICEFGNLDDTIIQVQGSKYQNSRVWDPSEVVT